MARQHGRNGRLYVGIASGGTPEPLPFIAKWSADFSTDHTDVTAQGDTNKVAVAGLPNASGDFSGFFDSATNQTYTAATDGVARKMYLYPDYTVTGTYWFGTAILDFKFDSDVSGANAISGTWTAASNWTRIG